MSTREASRLPAPGPEFLMGSGEHLYCLLMDVPSLQPVLQGSTESRLCSGEALGVDCIVVVSQACPIF